MCEKCGEKQAKECRCVVMGDPTNTVVQMMFLCVECDKIVWAELTQGVDVDV